MPAIFMHNQRGSTLIVSLLFLLILTVLGIASVSTTGLQERMAHNTREQNLALQAAEAALADGEDWLNAQRTAGAPVPASSCNGNCSTVPVFRDGLSMHANLSNENYSWWQSNAREHGMDPVTGTDRADLRIVAQQPFYLIREWNVADTPNSRPDSLTTGTEYADNRTRYYRIYGYGVGQTSYNDGSETRYIDALVESRYAIATFN